MILDLPLILETRRNHALEHATLHVLARKYPKQNMGGHSNPTGFLLYGKLDIQDIWTAATEAMSRLRAGESSLAVHPGCGTNLVTSSILAGALGWLPLRSAKSTFWRVWLIPTAVVFAAFGYFLSRPAGPWLQANVTTEADLGEMKIVDIVRLSDVVHRVITK